MERRPEHSASGRARDERLRDQKQFGEEQAAVSRIKRKQIPGGQRYLSENPGREDSHQPAVWRPAAGTTAVTTAARTRSLTSYWPDDLMAELKMRNGGRYWYLAAVMN